MLNDESYYSVCGWMRNRLKLKGNDLDVYALIWSFSQDGASEFRGSLAYIEEFTGAGRRTIQRSLDYLEGRGLIEKTDYNTEGGKTNGYKCVPLDKLPEVIEGGAKMTPLPPCQNDTRGCQNGVGECQNDTHILNNILPCIEKERKKEIINNSIIPRACTREGKKVDFSTMTDEELIAWGETPLDLSDPDAWDLFADYDEEVKKRKRTAGTKWKGKIIKNSNELKRLQSHAEIMDDCGVKGAYRTALENFLRHCYLNGHLVTNDKLLGIIVNLDMWYGKDYEEGKIHSIERAISGGYYDIREKAV